MAWYHVNGCDCPVGCCDCGDTYNKPKEYQDGVYMKKNGNLVLIYSEKQVDANGYEKTKICVDEGKKLTSKFGPVTIKTPIIMESTSRQLGWGPSKFLLKSEFLGDL